MPKQEPGLPSPLTALPGAVVPSGAMITPGGDQGPAGVQGTPGAAGPTQVSADAGNQAKLGSDSLMYVPPLPLADTTQAGLMHKVSGSALDYVGGDLACHALNVSGTPIGTVLLWAGATLPTGYLACDGSAVNRTTYSLLYTALGGASSPWGQGDGSTTFNLPDLRGRVPVGSGQGTGLSNRTLAGKGGEEAHTLALAEMPSHGHTDSGHTHADAGHTHADAGHVHSYSGPYGPGTQWQSGTGFGLQSSNVNSAKAAIQTAYASISTAAAQITATGGGGGHNNMQPYAVVQYVINATGAGALLTEIMVRMAALESRLAEVI